MAITEQDFIDGPETDHGVVVVRTPVTSAIDNVTGSKIRTEGTPVNITMVFNNPQVQFDLMQQGEQQGLEVIATVKGSVTIVKEDKITWNSIDFRVDDVSPRYFQSNIVFNKIRLILL